MRNLIFGILIGFSLAAGSLYAYDYDLNQSFEQNMNNEKAENQMQEQNNILRNQAGAQQFNQFVNPCE